MRVRCRSLDRIVAVKLARLLVAFGLTALLSACAHTGAPPPEQAPTLDRTAALRAIRDAGRDMDSAVQVQPLRDAAIDGYAQQSREAEARNDYAGAALLLEKALKLAPDAPDLLQSRAEIDIALGDFVAAEKNALQSFKLGPRVGSLCARNWQTVAQARTGMGDAATAQQAGLRLKECRVAAPVRM